MVSRFLPQRRGNRPIRGGVFGENPRVPITDLFAVLQALTLFAGRVTVAALLQRGTDAPLIEFLSVVFSTVSLSPASDSLCLSLSPCVSLWFSLPGTLQQTASCTSAKKHLVHPILCRGTGGVPPISPLCCPPLPACLGKPGVFCGELGSAAEPVGGTATQTRPALVYSRLNSGPLPTLCIIVRVGPTD